ncbi:hypothetical protein AVEN_130852-1 [Araneus ventricosus]|uniref:Uncharacterized protein n=1 Tax=Araneus ventricosus TaxID=182803 RepID=A0A4Y2WE59_ARAVE|nr:hypothetical protein AVEN_272852-1 [Araneus ventricosus]GBO34937.1 hypothetical protein AVEN_130852-1 [Araneus ventricosus]
MNRTRDYELLIPYQHGRENIETDDFQNIDKCQNIQDLLSAVCENNRSTIRMLSEECSINCGSVKPILIQDFGYETYVCQICVKTILCIPKEDRLSSTLNVLKMRKTFLKMIVTVVES